MTEKDLIENSLPLYKKEGYFLLNPFQSNTIRVYNYRFSKMTLMQQEVYGLLSQYCNTFSTTLSMSVDAIKLEIIRSHPTMPNPAVYYFKAADHLPEEETFLPIAKRILYRRLMNNSE